MKVAAGFELGAVIGPLIDIVDIRAVEKVETHIVDALKKGTKVVTGGAPMPPTVWPGTTAPDPLKNRD